MIVLAFGILLAVRFVARLARSADLCNAASPSLHHLRLQRWPIRRQQLCHPGTASQHRQHCSDASSRSCSHRRRRFSQRWRPSSGPVFFSIFRIAPGRRAYRLHPRFELASSWAVKTSPDAIRVSRATLNRIIFFGVSSVRLANPRPHTRPLCYSIVTYVSALELPALD